MGRFVLLPLAFFCSGAAALIFEVLWFRALGRLLGNTVWAGAVVLAAFMLGIALGGMLVARWSTRIRRPALAFALAECTVAAGGLAIVWGLPYAEGAVGGGLAPLVGHPELVTAVRLLLALGAMLVPTIAMGMTLALGVRALGASSTTQALGVIYAANTFGACVAPLVAEFGLIGAIGLRGSAVAAAMLNLVAAAIAAAVAARTVADPVPARHYRMPVRPLVAAALAGAVALALEVIWFRVLILFVSGSDENFAVMLSVMLVGIALGGALAPLLRRASIAWVASLSSVAVVLGYLMAGWIGHEVERKSELVQLLSYALPLMLPAAVTSGALFTLLGGRLGVDPSHAQSAVGRLTTANTLGAAAGAALGALVLLPGVGMELSLFLLAAAYIAIPLVLIEDRRTARAAWPALVALAGLAFFPFGRMAGHLSDAALPYQAADQGATVVSVVEGATTTLQLLRRDRLGEPLTWRLLTDSYTMTAINRSARRYMQLFAWLPFAFHPEPRRALLISYGAGNTARALLDGPELRELTVVDIAPEMLSVSPTVHGADDPLRDPRVRLVIEDGRHFLRTRREQFDVITAEPPPPGIAGVVNLYTREYFQALAARLAAGGIATYWLPVVQYEPQGARAVVAAFCDVFADCTLWTGNAGDWILMGSRGGVQRPTAEHIARLWRHPASARQLPLGGFEHPAQIGATFAGDADQLRKWVGATPMLTDDFPKRIAPGMRDASGSPEYGQWLDPERVRANFLESRWVREHWPAPLMEATAAYFRFQPVFNQPTPDDPSRALRQVDAILRDSDLRLPVLWLLDTDAGEIARVERRSRAGEKRPEFEYLLGLRALAERDYAGALERFSRAGPLPPGQALVAAYAACRARKAENCLQQ